MKKKTKCKTSGCRTEVDRPQPEQTNYQHWLKTPAQMKLHTKYWCVFAVFHRLFPNWPTAICLLRFPSWISYICWANEQDWHTFNSFIDKLHRVCLVHIDLYLKIFSPVETVRSVNHLNSSDINRTRRCCSNIDNMNSIYIHKTVWWPHTFTSNVWAGSI